METKEIPLSSTQKTQTLPVLAVFDFDKTMSDRHSFWRFMRFVAGSWKFYTAIIPLSGYLIGYFRKKITLMELREIVIQYFFGGIPQATFDQLGRQFAAQKIPAWISDEAVARLQWHQQQGHQTALVSNAAEEYIIPWAKTLGFEVTLGSRFATKEGVLTGMLEGTHCFGAEKVRRLEDKVGPLRQYELYMYGDSEGDKALLEIAQHPYYRNFHQETKYKA